MVTVVTKRKQQIGPEKKGFCDGQALDPNNKDDLNIDRIAMNHSPSITLQAHTYHVN